MDLKPPLRLAVGARAAYLAAMTGPVDDHPAQSFPITGSDAGADVGEPVRVGTRSTNRTVERSFGADLAVRLEHILEHERRGPVWRT